MISEPVKDPDGMGAEFARVNEYELDIAGENAWPEGRLREELDPDVEAELAMLGNGRWYGVPSFAKS